MTVDIVYFFEIIYIINFSIKWRMVKMYKDLIETNHILIALNTDDIGFELVYHRDEGCLTIRFLALVIAIS